MNRRTGQLLLLALLVLVAVSLWVGRAHGATPAMPSMLAWIGRCETGMRWDWNQRDYVSAFGMYRQTYEQGRQATHTRPWRYPYPTPAEQVKVALWVAGRYGWTAWGCGRR